MFTFQTHLPRSSITLLVDLLTVLMKGSAKHHRNMQLNIGLVLLELEAHSSELTETRLLCNAAASHQHLCRLKHVLCVCTHVCLLLLCVCACVSLCVPSVLLCMCVFESVCACCLTVCPLSFCTCVYLSLCVHVVSLCE